MCASFAQQLLQRRDPGLGGLLGRDDFLLQEVEEVLAVQARISTPFLASEMMPVSSLTMTTMASEFSLMPRPARWRVPISLPISRLLESGSTQPAR